MTVSQEFERLILISSPCRSGSTALLNAFAMAGYSSIFQPVKTSLRRFMVGDESSVNIDVKGSILIAKEALGPYQSSEVYYDPLKVLRNKTNVREVTLITLLREPQECLLSWYKGFSRSSIKDFKPNLLSESYTTVLKTYRQAQKEGVQTVALRLKDLSNTEILSSMLGEIGIPFRDEMINWERSVHYHSGAYAFQKPNEPEVFRVKGLLDGTKHGVSLSVLHSSSHAFNTERDFYPEKILNIAELSTAQAVYEEFSAFCIT